MSADVAAPEPTDREAAQERWNELKSRYRTDEKPAAPAATSSNRRNSPPIRSFPSDEPEEIAADEWLEEDELEAETSFESKVRPATIQPPAEPLPISESEVGVNRISGRAKRIAAQESTDDPKFLREEDLFLSPEADEAPPTRTPARVKEPAPEETPVPEAAMPEDPGYSPEVGERRLRKMSEITPHYDVNIDNDIREYAKEQAKRYNVEFRKSEFPQRNFPGFVYQWEPSNFYHYPLYFEDVPLERYGHTYHPVFQPVVSIAKFSTQLVFLPYQMTLDPICTPKYALGYYRPGECAPKLHYQPPLNAAAAAVEAGVITGLFYAIP